MGKIDVYKKAWERANEREKAGTISKERAKQLKDMAHKGAEAERAKTGYSGGDAGDKYIDINANDNVDYSQVKTKEDYDRVTKNYKSTRETASTPSNTPSRAVPTSNASDKTNQLLALQEKQRINDILANKRESLSNLEAQKDTIEPAYRTARSDTRASGKRSAKNFDEYLATRGLSNSGASAQGQIAQSNVTQGALGDLRMQETQSLDDIERQRASINRQALSDQSTARNITMQNQLKADIEGAKMTPYEQWEAQQQYYEEKGIGQYAPKVEDTNNFVKMQSDLKEAGYSDSVIKSIMDKELGINQPTSQTAYIQQQEYDRAHGIGAFAPEQDKTYSPSSTQKDYDAFISMGYSPNEARNAVMSNYSGSKISGNAGGITVVDVIKDSVNSGKYQEALDFFNNPEYADEIAKVLSLEEFEKLKEQMDYIDKYVQYGTNSWK